MASNMQEDRDSNAWNSTVRLARGIQCVGQCREALTWNPRCGTMLSVLLVKFYAWDNAGRIAHGIQCTEQCGEDRVKPSMRETTQRWLCRASIRGKRQRG